MSAEASPLPDPVIAQAVVDSAAADEAELLAAVEAAAASHAGRPVFVVLEVLRHQLDSRGLDGWAVTRPALTTIAERISGGGAVWATRHNAPP